MQRLKQPKYRAALGVLLFLIGAGTIHFVSKTGVFATGGRNPSDDGTQLPGLDRLQAVVAQWEESTTQATVALQDTINEVRDTGRQPGRVAQKAQALTQVFSTAFTEFAAEVAQCGSPQQINQTCLSLLVGPLDSLHTKFARSLSLLSGAAEWVPQAKDQLFAVRLSLAAPYAHAITDVTDSVRRTQGDSNLETPHWDFLLEGGNRVAKLKVDILEMGAANIASLLATPSERGIWNALREQAIRMTILTKVKFESLLFQDQQLPFQLGAGTSSRHRALLSRAYESSNQDPYLTFLVPSLSDLVSLRVGSHLPTADQVTQNSRLTARHPQLSKIEVLFTTLVKDNLDKMDRDRLLASGIINAQIKQGMERANATDRRSLGEMFGRAAVKWFLSDHHQQSGWKTNIESYLTLSQLRMSELSSVDAKRVFGEQIIGDHYASILGSLFEALMSKSTGGTSLDPSVEFRFIVESNALASELGAVIANAIWPEVQAEISRFNRMTVEPVMLQRDRLVNRLVSGARVAQSLGQALVATREVGTVDVNDIPQNPDFGAVISAVGRVYASRAEFSLQLMAKLAQQPYTADILARNRTVTEAAFNAANSIKLAFHGNSARRQVVIQALSRQLSRASFKHKPFIEQARLTRAAVSNSQDTQLLAGINALLALSRIEAEFDLPVLKMSLQRVFRDLYLDRDYAFISLFEGLEASKKFLDEHGGLVIDLLGPPQSRVRMMRDLLRDVGVFRKYLVSRKEQLALELPFLFEEVTIPRRIMASAHMSGGRKVPFWELILRVEGAANRLGLRNWFLTALNGGEFIQAVQAQNWTRSFTMPVTFDQLLSDALQGIDGDTQGGVMGRVARFFGQIHAEIANDAPVSEEMSLEADWPTQIKVRDMHWERERLRSENAAIRTSAQDHGLLRVLVGAFLPVVLKEQLRYSNHNLVEFLNPSRNLNRVLLESQSFENIAILAGGGSEEPSAELRALESRYEDIRNDALWFRRIHGGLKMITSTTQEYSHPTFMATILFDMGGFWNTIAHKYMFFSMIFDLSADALSWVDYWQTYETIEPYAHTNALGGGLFSSDQLYSARSQFESASENLLGRLPWDIPWIYGTYRQSVASGQMVNLQARAFADRALRMFHRGTLREVMIQKAEVEILMREVGIRRSVSQTELETQFGEREADLLRRAQGGDRRASNLLNDWRQLLIVNRQLESNVLRLRAALMRSERIQLGYLRARGASEPIQQRLQYEQADARRTEQLRNLEEGAQREMQRLLEVSITREDGTATTTVDVERAPEARDSRPENRDVE